MSTTSSWNPQFPYNDLTNVEQWAHYGSFILVTGVLTFVLFLAIPYLFLGCIIPITLRVLRKSFRLDFYRLPLRKTTLSCYIVTILALLLCLLLAVVFSILFLVNSISFSQSINAAYTSANEAMDQSVEFLSIKHPQWVPTFFHSVSDMATNYAQQNIIQPTIHLVQTELEQPIIHAVDNSSSSVETIQLYINQMKLEMGTSSQEDEARQQLEAADVKLTTIRNQMSSAKAKLESMMAMIPLQTSTMLSNMQTQIQTKLHEQYKPIETMLSEVADQLHKMNMYSNETVAPIVETATYVANWEEIVRFVLLMVLFGFCFGMVLLSIVFVGCHVKKPTSKLVTRCQICHSVSIMTCIAPILCICWILSYVLIFPMLDTCKYGYTVLDTQAAPLVQEYPILQQFLPLSHQMSAVQNCQDNFEVSLFDQLQIRWEQFLPNNQSMDSLLMNALQQLNQGVNINEWITTHVNSQLNQMPWNEMSSQLSDLQTQLVRMKTRLAQVQQEIETWNADYREVARELVIINQYVSTSISLSVVTISNIDSMELDQVILRQYQSNIILWKTSQSQYSINLFSRYYLSIIWEMYLSSIELQVHNLQYQLSQMQSLRLSLDHAPSLHSFEQSIITQLETEINTQVAQFTNLWKCQPFGRVVYEYDQQLCRQVPTSLIGMNLCFVFLFLLFLMLVTQQSTSDSSYLAKRKHSEVIISSPSLSAA